MQKAANTSRFLIDLSLGRELADQESLTGRESLLQHFLAGALGRAANSREIFNELGRRLIRLAQHAYSLRDAATLQEASQLLVNLPAANVRQVGQYYRALAARRMGKIDEAVSLLEAVADNAPLAYRARAIQTLGAIHHRQGRLDEAVRLYPEALRVASSEDGRDFLTTLLIHLEISCIKSEVGNHPGALTDLERLSPLVRIVSRQNPLYFYFYHNELAVEFAELGRIAEAEAALSIALASPFASAYPEWSETRDELEAKRTSATPSVVAIIRAPEAESSPQAEPQRKPEPFTARGLSRLASKKDSFHTTVISIAATTVLNRSGNTLLIVYCLRKCVRTRGPPPLSQETFRSLSKSIVESADENARAAQNRFAVELFCAQSYHSIVVISVCVSLCCRNYISRAPPLRRDGESEAGSLSRLASISSVNCLKAYGDQHVQLSPVHRREVNPHNQLGRFQRIRAGRRVCDSLPPLTAQVRVEELPMTNTRACAGGYL